MDLLTSSITNHVTELLKQKYSYFIQVYYFDRQDWIKERNIFMPWLKNNNLKFLFEIL